MPSSISSSEPMKLSGKIWLTAIASSLLVLIGMEIFFRAMGYPTVITDDAALWSLERDKLGKSPKEFVLIGASRIQLGFDMQLFREKYPDYNIINLAIDGSNPKLTLEALAKDEDFCGIVLCSINEAAILNADPGRSQAYHNNYYRNNYNLNTRINREISTFLQKNLVLANPLFNPVNFAESWISLGEMPSENYLKTFEDRSRRADYTLVDIKKHRRQRIDIELKYLKFIESKLSIEKFHKGTSVLRKYSEMIRNRGGVVLFIRYPTSDALFERENELFPRNEFWDYFGDNVGAPCIYFADYPELSKFKLPETSHLDQRDVSEFTESIISILEKEKIFDRKGTK